MGGRGSGFGGGFNIGISVSKKRKADREQHEGPVVLLTGDELKDALIANTKKKQKSIDNFVTYLNNSSASNEVRKIFNDLPKLKRNYIDNNNVSFKVKYTNAKNANYQVSSTYRGGRLLSVVITIPYINQSDYNLEAFITVHELAHFIDNAKKNSIYSSKSYSNDSIIFQRLIANGPNPGSEVSNYFTDIKNRVVLIQRDYQQKLAQDIIEIQNRNLSVSQTSSEIRNLGKHYNALFKEEINNNKDLSLAKSMSDIYDALSNGLYFDNKIVIGGHGQRYYQEHNGQQRAKEIFANYIQLKTESPELVEMLRRDKPDLVKELDSIIENI